ncbi:hypothetical protein BGZ61DRAFT_376581 [Ilyonectria robusta]|uniref:uncharacterized protein n=1 Tax=Ilyonectria robusta TaxID=1079257 RepID=UPI001E8E77BE|nr:uncharacterized protein BGZ61DRAFT_376581 [Ilyonectria robusta]KAH8647637.1 hypothetical protein BGZ61DRAFT_376581 [Ilyonectria robusta]
MADADVIVFNVATFLAALFLLEFGADKFIDHTAVVARRTGLPETVVGLLTAGGEWEELVVVVASLARGRSSLAMGNVIGAAISNILGAFSLGLLSFETGRAAQFDRSARIYSLVLLVLTTFVIPILYFPTHVIWEVCGPVLIATFGIYLLLVGLAIGRGVLTAPEDSDSDSDSDSDAESDADVDNDRHSSSDARIAVSRAEATETDPLINPRVPKVRAASPGHHPEATPQPVPSRRRRPHTLGYHGLYLLFGFIAICLAGYILSQAAANITDQFGISDVLFGVVILAIATTLPEKFIAVMSGYRGHPGILVANCVGSNIFLLSLCVGIIMVDTTGALDGGNVTMPELVALWGSTLGLTLTVWFGARFCRWIGVAMLVGYVVFIVLEVTVIHRVAN